MQEVYRVCSQDPRNGKGTKGKGEGKGASDRGLVSGRNSQSGQHAQQLGESVLRFSEGMVIWAAKPITHDEHRDKRVQ